MTFVRALLLTATALTALSASEKSLYHWSEDVPGFSRTRVLSDGERERRVHYGRLTAVETSVDLDQDNALVLRQVSDGSSFLQLILNRHQELVDCEYLKDPRAVSRFFRNLAEDFACAEHRSSLHRGNGSVLCELSSLSTPPSTNDTFRLIRSARDVGADWKELLDLRLLRRKCRKLHRQIRLALREQQGTAGKSHPDETSVDTEDGAESLDVDSNQVEVPTAPKTSFQLLRKKRDLFLYPGTNWCGSGNSARKFTELGVNARADRCCRDHDHCPFTIEAFKKKFHLFNYRFHTVSHCECDERFRSCLKMGNNAASHMVGKLYFNIVQTKCFTFKKQDVCHRRSWWGKCVQRSREKVALLRDGMSF
ncbi:unnamed protein product [Ixodes pacificus]